MIATFVFSALLGLLIGSWLYLANKVRYLLKENEESKQVVIHAVSVITQLASSIKVFDDKIHKITKDQSLFLKDFREFELSMSEFVIAVDNFIATNTVEAPPTKSSTVSAKDPFSLPKRDKKVKPN